MKLRQTAAILAARLISWGCKKSGRQGVTFAGKIALKIDPNILRDLAGQVRGGIFAVCGTNGKTTTNNLLCDMVEAEGKKLICNRTGSNMLQGVVAAFVLAATWNGKIDADYACIEIDEASTLRVFPHFQPDYMVITNLFRDQLDRYGEIDGTMDLLARAIQMAPDVKLIINGDDALLAYLARESGREYITIGISEQVVEQQNTHEIREGRFCKCCGARLEYNFYHYSQLGSYSCPNCGFARPKIDFNASNVRIKNGLEFDVDGRHFRSNANGLYHVYNYLAVYGAAKTAGMGLGRFEQILQEYNPANGRDERFVIGGSKVLLNLAKNPTGFNQNIAAVMEDESEKDIIIVINDNAQDGEDVSWLWDVDFDCMTADNIRTVTVSGIRCQDMRLRLKYIGRESELISDVKTAIEARLRDGCGNLYVLVNYTALQSTHTILKAMENENRSQLHREQSKSLAAGGES